MSSYVVIPSLAHNIGGKVIVEQDFYHLLCSCVVL